MIGGAHRVCLLLGSNIRPEAHLKCAFDLLRGQVSIEKVSAIWKTPAVGTSGPDFLNVAVLATTDLSARELKENVLRPLESQLGRVRGADKNAARPIDLDIIIYDSLLLDPNLWRQAHRAVPVSEILPDYRSETGVLLKDAADLLAGTTPMTLIPGILDGV